MLLATPQDVIRRANLSEHPEYEDVSPFLDSAGFYTFRRYPSTTDLARVVTKDGRPAVRCYLAFIILPPRDDGTVSRVLLKAWFSRRWRPGRVFASHGDPYEPPPNHPDAPTADSAVILARTRAPLDLNNTDVGSILAEGRVELDFTYDHLEDVFLDGDGNRVTPAQILDSMYQIHCRTLRLGFRVRWTAGSVARRTAWKGQDVAMWALFKFYDREIVEEKQEQLNKLFYRYTPGDFRRVTDNPNERSNFFGFQSSQKSFLTNLAVVVGACLVFYWKGPRDGLVRVIYNNPALTTAALLFAFLLADTVGPWILIRTICTLSRTRNVGSSRKVRA